MFISPAEISEMNADLETTLDSAGQVLRDIGGAAPDGKIQNFQPLGKPMKCAAWQDDQKELSQGASVTAVAAWKVCVPLRTVVAAGDRVQIGALLLRVSGTDGGQTDGIGQILDCVQVSG